MLLRCLGKNTVTYFRGAQTCVHFETPAGGGCWLLVRVKIWKLLECYEQIIDENTANMWPRSVV